MKKNYIKPTQRIHNVRFRTNMLDGSPAYNTTGTDQPQLGKERDLWDNSSSDEGNSIW